MKPAAPVSKTFIADFPGSPSTQVTAQAPRRQGALPRERRGARLRAMRIRPAEPRDAAFLGWVCVAAARSQLTRGWFDIVLERDDAFVVEFARHLTLAGARSWWHWSLFHVAEI